jgi:hypothetical protein
MKKKYVITTIVTSVFLLSFSLFAWLKPADEFSLSERRSLEQFPELNFSAIASGRFMKEFEDYTLEEYAELLVEANGLSSDVKIKDGMTFFDYQKKSSKDQKIYRYRAYVYKSDDAFWMIQFAIETKNYDDYADSIDEWARSVSFK